MRGISVGAKCCASLQARYQRAISGHLCGETGLRPRASAISVTSASGGSDRSSLIPIYQPCATIAHDGRTKI